MGHISVPGFCLSSVLAAVLRPVEARRPVSVSVSPAPGAGSSGEMAADTGDITAFHFAAVTAAS